MSEPTCIGEVERWVKRLTLSAARTECLSCECFQALLTKVRHDFPEASTVATPLQVSAKKMHHCLGCAPCPPGDVFAEYLSR